ncbi:MAG TPA: GxxExxY protein [Vicinamibacterales bacterium]
MEYDKAKIDALRGQVIGCAIEVHRQLGPGLLESVYQACLVIELRRAGLQVAVNKYVPLTYKGDAIGTGLFLDLLVQGVLVLEVKSVERLGPIHVAQVITYLKLADRPAGLLLNFNSVLMKDGIKRVTHPALIDPDLPRLHKARLL